MTKRSNAEIKEYLFRSLTPEELEKVPVPSKEEIRAALRKAREDLRRAAAAPARRFPCSGLRYR